MLIKVTEDHIKNGQPRSACECPIALAIKEATRCLRAGVGLDRAIIDGRYFDLSKRARDFIRDFDDPNRRSRLFTPFEFELEGPFGFEIG
jgi:hypothetical protein